MPTFQPKTENEVTTANLFPAGVYDYEVAQADDVTSKKSGEPMIKLKLKVFDKDGNSRVVFDNLMFLESMAFKLRHACYASGVGVQYEKGQIEAIDFNGVVGKVKLKQTPAKNGHPAKNEVVDYIVEDDSKSQREKTNVAEKDEEALKDDSIPF